MIVDGWDIDEAEVLASDYAEGAVFRVSNLIAFTRRAIEAERIALLAILESVLDEQRHGIPDRLISDTLELEIEQALARNDGG